MIYDGPGLENISNRTLELRGDVHVSSGSKGTTTIISIPYKPE